MTSPDIAVLSTRREFRRAGRRWSDYHIDCATCGDRVGPADHIEVLTVHARSVAEGRYTVWHWRHRPAAVERDLERLGQRVETGRHWLARA